MPVDVQHPILVKIAPDLTEVDKEDIAAVVTRKQVCFVLFGPSGFVLLIMEVQSLRNISLP